MLRQRDQRIEELEKENALLRQKVDLLIRKVFGASSEKFDPAQLDLFLLQAEIASGKSEASSALEEADPQPSRHRPLPKEKHLPENLPVIEQVIDPEEVKEAPDQCRCIGSEVSEQLDYEPARFLKGRLVRRKYVARHNPEDAPVIAELPPRLQERSIPAAGLLALDYTLNLWPLLGVYLEDGRIEIDQNLVENSIRPTALGKKNWLFIGEAEAGERSAILHTIVECRRRRGIDPFAYLRDILTRLPSATNWQIADLTPEAWAREHQPPLRQAA